jgi:outer membrane protein W
MKKRLFLGTLAFSVAYVASAFAQEVSDPWILRVGFADLEPMKKFTLSVAGQPVPGAALSYPPIYTALIEIGWFIEDDWALVATLGAPPPHIAIHGAGSITAYDKLESTTFGASTLTEQFQPFHDGFAQPYIGAGITYMLIFSTQGSAIQQPRLSNDLGFAFEVGSDFRISDQFGLFAEAKKTFLHDTSTGTLGVNAIRGTATLDPGFFRAASQFASDLTPNPVQSADQCDYKLLQRRPYFLHPLRTAWRIS